MNRSLINLEWRRWCEFSKIALFSKYDICEPGGVSLALTTLIIELNRDIVWARMCTWAMWVLEIGQDISSLQLNDLLHSV
jgi:hypothetical protein